MGHWLDAHELAFYIVTSWINFAGLLFFLGAWLRACRDRDRARATLVTALREFAEREGARSYQSQSPPREP